MNMYKIALLIMFASSFAYSPPLWAMENDNDLFFDCPCDDFAIRWAFQELCDFSYDTRRVCPTPTKPGACVSFDPSKVKPGDMIFVRDAPYYFKNMHRKIEVPYFIMTHGECLDKFQDSFFKYLEDKNILGWFTVHPCAHSHPRVFALPLGVNQSWRDLYEKGSEAHKKFISYRKQKKTKLLFMNFTDWHNPERTRIRELFLKKGFCTYKSNQTFQQFVKDMAQHKFTISPPGLAPDCYRVYESLLVGTIPVVQHSHLDWLYEGLPVLFIDRWEDVTEEFLHEQYELIRSKKYDPKKLYMPYWLDQIKITRERIFNEYLQKSTNEFQLS